jgi:hypothetical protein
MRRSPARLDALDLPKAAGFIFGRNDASRGIAPMKVPFRHCPDGAPAGPSEME